MHSHISVPLDCLLPVDCQQLDWFCMAWLSVLDRAVGSFLYPEKMCIPLVLCLHYNGDLTRGCLHLIQFLKISNAEKYPQQSHSYCLACREGFQRFELLSLLAPWTSPKPSFAISRCQSQWLTTYCCFETSFPLLWQTSALGKVSWMEPQGIWSVKYSVAESHRRILDYKVASGTTDA